MFVLTAVLLALCAGSAVYCILVIVAAHSYLAVRPRSVDSLPFLSILKPLYGADEGLADNLRSFFSQDYPSFEILAAVRQETDVAVPIFRQLQTEFPNVPSRLLLTGEPPYPNAKVWSLQHLDENAGADILVMSDSDIRVRPGALRVLAAEFADPRVGVTTSPYRAVAGDSLWSQLEAIGMNTEFLSGVLTARLLDGMKFAIGPTITARKEAIQSAGGWPLLSEFLAEDFVLGNAASAKGWTVLLSACVIEHRIGAQSFRANARHRLRWFRSTRRSRPAGYVGQIFTNPLPLAIALVVVAPSWWAVAVALTGLRAACAVATAVWVLREKLTVRSWVLLAVQDLLSFGFWLAGFFGNTILWRGRRFRLLPDGRFTPS